MNKLEVNEREVEIHAPDDTPLLWVLRDELKLTGTKYGCGKALCGACSVLIDGKPQRSCVTPVASVAGKAVITIEGARSVQAQAVIKAWMELEVAQCGYCQSGQIIAAIGLLSGKPKPDDADIDTAMDGNVCRCATYQRIRRAVHRAAELLA